MIFRLDGAVPTLEYFDDRSGRVMKSGMSGLLRTGVHFQLATGRKKRRGRRVCGSRSTVAATFSLNAAILLR